MGEDEAHVREGRHLQRAVQEEVYRLGLQVLHGGLRHLLRPEVSPSRARVVRVKASSGGAAAVLRPPKKRNGSSRGIAGLALPCTTYCILNGYPFTKMRLC